MFLKILALNLAVALVVSAVVGVIFFAADLALGIFGPAGVFIVLMVAFAVLLSILEWSRARALKVKQGGRS